MWSVTIPSFVPSSPAHAASTAAWSEGSRLSVRIALPLASVFTRTSQVWFSAFSGPAMISGAPAMIR